MNTLVFIPAYNCEKQIVRVLSQFTASVCATVEEILVIDNCSADNTLQNACAAAEKISAPITILKNTQNYNYGGSMKIAIRYAIEKNFDYIIVLHGDDQAHIADFEALLSTKEYASYDAVFGARFHPASTIENYSRFRTIGNYGLNLICSALIGRCIYDLGSGLNLYNVGALKKLPFMSYKDDLCYSAHLHRDLMFKGNSIQFYPISWRQLDQVSNAKLFKQSIQLIGLFATSRLGILHFDTCDGAIEYTYNIAYTNRTSSLE